MYIGIMDIYITQLRMDIRFHNNIITYKYCRNKIQNLILKLYI